MFPANDNHKPSFHRKLGRLVILGAGFGLVAILIRSFILLVMNMM